MSIDLKDLLAALTEYWHRETKSLEAELQAFKTAHSTWLEKSKWAMDDSVAGKFPFSTIGMHWADMIRAEVERLRAANVQLLDALRIAEDSVGDMRSLEIVRAAIAKATGQEPA